MLFESRGGCDECGTEGLPRPNIAGRDFIASIFSAALAAKPAGFERGMKFFCCRNSVRLSNASTARPRLAATEVDFDMVQSCPDAAISREEAARGCGPYPSPCLLQTIDAIHESYPCSGIGALKVM